MKKKLIIELLSDCLPGSGSGNGSYIDTDCVFDVYGFPFIPAKRIKGCLRETAEKLQRMGYKISKETLEILFGTETVEGSIHIGNAHIQGIDSIHRAVEYYKAECEKNREDNKKVDFILAPDAIQEYYTCLHSRTAIDEKGIAKDKSLRTVRALKKGTIFEAEISFPKEQLQHISEFVKALRYIGTNRNRGFGHVRLTLIDANTDARFSESDAKGDVLELQLLLKMPVLVDEMHIPGVMIRGALAALWMKHHEAPEGGDYFQCKTFRDLFIDGLRYEPAFPTDENNTRYLPVPASVVRYKVPEADVCEYVDLAVDPAPKAQTKRISAGTVYAPIPGKQNRMYVIQPTRREFMHHSQSGELFTYSALEEGERYLARISGDPNALKTLQCFIKEYQINELRIGRSRTAQYGSVVITDLVRRQRNNASVTGKHFAMTLQTSAILLDGEGTPMTDCPSLFKALGEKYPAVMKNGKIVRCFSVSGSIEGYNPQWKLSKQPVPALGATTTVVFTTSTEVTLPEFVWLGERNQEGYGLAHIRQANKNAGGFDAKKPLVDVPMTDFGADWNAFLAKYKDRYILHHLRMMAVEKSPEKDPEFAPNSRTIQRLYAITMGAIGKESFSLNIIENSYVGNIKEQKKKEHCQKIISDAKKELENPKPFFDSVIGEIQPPLAIDYEGIKNNDEYCKFYLSEKLRIAVLRKRVGE